jgi:pimeloyl-ACP methyl ester carboxylesterase
MTIIDVGSGTPVVLVPGIQGRWEWMKPTVDALARHCRVITFSLADEPTCRARFDPAHGFDCYVQQIADAMDQAGVTAASICGVSYGGLIASAFAARHVGRTASLVLVSALPPTWEPDRRARFFLQAPWLLSPLFVIGSLRMYREIAAANPGVLQGIRAGITHGWTAVTHMFSPGRMARRVHLLERLDLSGELSEVRAPVLVITGDAHLDGVVPVSGTLEYLAIWPQARAVTLPHTGHLGSITRPAAFAQLVAPFAASSGDRPAEAGPALSEVEGPYDHSSATEHRRRLG